MTTIIDSNGRIIDNDRDQRLEDFLREMDEAAEAWEFRNH